MATNWKSKVFLQSGIWLPLEVVAPLSQHLKLLQRWAIAHQPLDPSVKLLIRLELLDIEHLLELGETSNVLVSARHWNAAVQKLQLLTEALHKRRQRW